MEFWQATAFSELDQMVTLAPAIEELGFGGVAVSEHLFMPADLKSAYPYTPDGDIYWDSTTPWPDPWVLIGAMAAVTQRIRFTTNAYIVPLRDVFSVAKVVATAATVSGNRVALGAGIGWMREEFEAVGQDFTTRGKRFDEMIEILRGLWRGGMFEHHGRFHDFGPIEMAPAPTAPVPIWIAGQSDVALRRAARVGDGWIGLYCTADEAFALLATLSKFRAAEGRAAEPFEAMFALTEEPTYDLCRRLDDAGATILLTSAWMVAGGDTSTIEAKRAALERFAERYIAKLGPSAERLARPKAETRLPTTAEPVDAAQVGRREGLS